MTRQEPSPAIRPPESVTPPPVEPANHDARRTRYAALACRFLDLVSAHDLDGLCALVTPDWAMEGGPPDLPRGPEGVRVLFGTFGPIEQTWTVHDVLVEGDRVLVRATNACRQEHFAGVPSHGRVQTFTAMFLHRVVEDAAGVARIAETWRNANDLGRVLQLGARLVADGVDVTPGAPPDAASPARPAARPPEPASPLVARVRRAIAAHQAAAHATPADGAGVPAADSDAVSIHADDVVLHAPGASPIGGTTRGRVAAFAKLARLRALSGGTYAVAASTVAGQGPFVAVIHRVTAARGDRRLDQAIGELWRFDGTGPEARCREAWLQFEDPAAWDAFWR